MNTKLCACGCPHIFGPEARDDHSGRPGCRCDGFITPRRADRFQIEHAKYLARLNTPEEQAKIDLEIARLREEAKRQEPLSAVLRRIRGKRSRH